MADESGEPLVDGEVEVRANPDTGRVEMTFTIHGEEQSRGPTTARWTTAKRSGTSPPDCTGRFRSPTPE